MVQLAFNSACAEIPNIPREDSKNVGECRYRREGEADVYGWTCVSC